MALPEPEKEQVLRTHRSSTSPQAPAPRDYRGRGSGPRAQNAGAAPPQRPQTRPSPPGAGRRARPRESPKARDKAARLYKSRDHLSRCFRKRHLARGGEPGRVGTCLPGLLARAPARCAGRPCAVRGAASGRAPFREQPQSHRRGQTGTGIDSRPRRPSPLAPRGCLSAAVHLRFRLLKKVLEPRVHSPPPAQ